jgi:hypothetical protein
MFVIYIYLFVWMGCQKQIKKAVFSHFAECNGHDTRQSDNMLCREPRSRHSAKMACLPSVLPVALGTDATFAECLIHWRSAKRRPLPSVRLALGKAFAECPIKCTRQRGLCRQIFYRAPFAECSTRQSLCRVYIVLCRVPEALGKEAVSGSVCMTPLGLKVWFALFRAMRPMTAWHAWTNRQHDSFYLWYVTDFQLVNTIHVTSPRQILNHGDRN